MTVAAERARLTRFRRTYAMQYRLEEVGSERPNGREVTESANK